MSDYRRMTRLEAIVAWSLLGTAAGFVGGYVAGWVNHKPQTDVQLAEHDCWESFQAATDGVVRQLVDCNRNSREQDSLLKDCREDVDHLLRSKYGVSVVCRSQ